jgi:hypothetical protein
MINNIAKLNENTQKALTAFKKIEENQKFSAFAREKFNEIGMTGKMTKAEEMLDRVHQIAIDSDAENSIKAIKVFAEMVGGGLNEKQVSNTNVQINLGDVLDKLK